MSKECELIEQSGLQRHCAADHAFSELPHRRIHRRYTHRMGHHVVTRMGALAATVLLVTIGFTSPVGTDQEGGLATGWLPSFTHIFIVVMENQEFNDVLGNTRAPYVNALAQQYGLAREFYAVTHPSLPNYLALLGGDTFGVTEDCSRCFQSASSLVDQIEASGRTWKAYFESMPNACYTGDSPDGLYAQKHNPFIYFDVIRQNPDPCGRIVPLQELTSDLALNNLPNLVWIGPNLQSSTHDASISVGDRWLAELLPNILDSPAFKDGGLLVLTYDEGSSDASCCGRKRGGGKIMTVLASPYSRSAFSSTTPYDHYSLLRTIEDAWGLGPVGHAGDSLTRNLGEFFEMPEPS